MRKTLKVEESKLKLYGMWGSSYITRVELALKLKGISYEHVEEDLLNKSQLLLQHNPVNKKIPVLVHHGKPIVELLFILELMKLGLMIPNFCLETAIRESRFDYGIVLFNRYSLIVYF